MTNKIIFVFVYLFFAYVCCPLLNVCSVRVIEIYEWKSCLTRRGKARERAREKKQRKGKEIILKMVIGENMMSDKTIVGDYVDRV